MDSRTGKKIRLSRLFRESGHTIIFPCSHAVLEGPIPGLTTREEMIKAVEAARIAEAVILSPGQVAWLEDQLTGKDRPTLMIGVDWENLDRGMMLPPPEGATCNLATLEECAAAGADGVMTYFYVGFKDAVREKWEVERNARIARECDRLGLVWMAEALLANPEDMAKGKCLRFAARMAAEIGADLLKVFFTVPENEYADVICSSPVPVVMAGGPKAKTALDFLTQVHIALKLGARGAVPGRNIFQHADPTQMMRALEAVVHHGASPHQAVKTHRV